MKAPTPARIAKASPRVLGTRAILLVALLLLLLMPCVWAADRVDRPVRILVMPKPGLSQGDLDRFHSKHRLRLLRSHQALGNLQVVELPAGVKTADAIQAYTREGLALFAEPDAKIRAHLLPNDPSVTNGIQWHLNNRGISGGRVGADLQAGRAWDSLREAPQVIVAVVDSGIRYTHEDLAGNMWRNPGEIPGNGRDDDRNGIVDDVFGINAADNNGDPMDTIGHGTHVAGIIGAVGNNGTGGSGVAWKVQLMACRFLVEGGEGNLSDAVRCLDYARAKGASVINCSWGSTANSASLSAAIDRLRAAGIVVVVSAGNEESNNDEIGEYPANYTHDNLIVVAATTSSDRLASFSNFGATRVDLGAPGLAIHSTWYTSDSAYTLQSGTSMSAPMVSGAMALLRTKFPAETPAQLIDRALSTSDPLSDLAGKSVSGGRLNLRRALEEALFADFTVSVSQGSPPLTVSFTNVTRGLTMDAHWDFGDGTSSSDANPTHVFEFEGNFPVTLRVTGTNGVESSKTRAVVALGNYTSSPHPFAWVEPTGADPLILFDDDASLARRLPFPFRFYGRIYEEVYVGANGLIGFRSEDLESRANSTLPAIAPPNGIVCPYWDNLNPELGGTVTAESVGVAPRRRFVVTWSEVPMNLGGLPLTFQAILEEGTGNIVFQYLEVHPESFRAGGLGATVGVENESGETAFRYLFNGAPRTLTNQQAVLIQPRFSPGMRAVPVGSLASSGSIGGPFAPVSFSVSMENLGQTPIRWRARHAATWLRLTSETGTIPAGSVENLLLRLDSSANLLPAGTYADTLELFNESTGIGNARFPVSLTIQGQAGELGLAQDAEFISSGFEGGPFAPSSRIYTLSNQGDAPIEWKASVAESWVSVSPAHGTLGPGESEALVARLTSSAWDLAIGTHRAAMKVVNVTTGRGGGERPITVHVLSQAAPTLGISRNGERIHAVISSKPGETVRIEVSEDLLTWKPFQTGTTSTEGTLLLELSIGSSKAAYFRAVLDR